MSLKNELIKEIFYEDDYDLDLDENPSYKHAITNEHEEVLGQFLDFTGIDPEELKNVLVEGYIFR